MKAGTFDPAKKAAAEVAATKLRNAGFEVTSVGFGAAVVNLNGRLVQINAHDVDIFIQANQS